MNDALRPQAMQVDEEENRIFQALVLSFGWLTKRELCFVSTMNSTFLAASRQDYLWRPPLLELEETGLHDSELASCDRDNRYFHYSTALVPRIRGDRCDDYSYFPHPRDKGPRRAPEPLVLVSERCSHNMKVDHGVLYDCFRRARDSRDSRDIEMIWLKRDFPIHCEICEGAVLKNEDEMFRHCCTFDHAWRSVPEEDRVPPEFIDPRHQSNYSAMTVFDKVRTLLEYRARVVRALRSIPLDEAGTGHMLRQVDNFRWNVKSMYEDYHEIFSEEEYEVALSKCSLDCVMDAAVEKVLVSDFLDHGLTVNNNLCLRVLRDGWTEFNVYDSRHKQFLYDTTGWEFC